MVQQLSWGEAGRKVSCQSLPRWWPCHCKGSYRPLGEELMAFLGGFLVFLRVVSGESQAGGNPSSGRDGVPGTDSVGSRLLWRGGEERKGPGGGQHGWGAIAGPQGQYQSSGESTCSGRAEHCSVLASASLLAAWSLDLLPGQVKRYCLPQARSLSRIAHQAGLVMRRVPLSPRVVLLSFRLSWFFPSRHWYGKGFLSLVLWLHGQKPLPAA